MRANLFPLSTIVFSLVLGLGATNATAQPPENRGKGESHQGKHAKHESSADRQKNPSQRKEEKRLRGGELTIEEAVIREIFREQRGYIETTRSLPPGIQKQLARGKPLPPGIAKKFDGRVLSRLPSYTGYDWRQVGTDAVLIDVTTGIVEAIISNVLY